MNKNISIACGLGDMFVFLTKLENFFEKNPEYKSVSFWTWMHSPALAKELCSISGLPVSSISVEDAVNYLQSGLLSEEELTRAAPHFIKQDKGGVGVDKYINFMHTFFPNIEEWIYLATYNKYKSKYPFFLAHGEPSMLKDEPYFVAHPFSTAVKTEKAERLWTPDRWHTLFELIGKRTPTKIVLIGAEYDIIEENKLVRSYENRNVIDMRGKLSLTESINMVYGAKAVFGTNTLTTEISAWAGIPTYVQWFVQHQLIPSHLPLPEEELKHVFIQRPILNQAGEVRPLHPTVNQAWDIVRKVIEYAAIPIYGN